MAQRSRPLVDIATGCACGAVSVAVKGPVFAMFMCSCEDCQKASGTGHSAVALVSPRSVTVTGEVRSFARQANSGATFTRHFCPACGTPLYGISSRAPEAMLLPVGLLGGGAGWFRPSQLIFARTHREWDEIAADIPRHETYRNPEGTF